MGLKGWKCLCHFYQVASIIHSRGGKIKKSFFWAYLECTAKMRAQLLARCCLLKEGRGTSLQNASTLADIALQATYARSTGNLSSSYIWIYLKLCVITWNTRYIYSFIIPGGHKKCWVNCQRGLSLWPDISICSLKISVYRYFVSRYRYSEATHQYLTTIFMPKQDLWKNKKFSNTLPLSLI